MCQLCTIKTIATRDRWPRPLEQHIKDLEFLVTSAHDEYAPYLSRKASDSKTTKPTHQDSLLNILRLLATVLEELETERQKWWTSPAKRDLRRRLDEEDDQQKRTALHKINNDTVDRIQAMDAKLGQFVKWSLGINGGIEELQQGHKVDGTKQSKEEVRDVVELLSQCRIR